MDKFVTWHVRNSEFLSIEANNELADLIGEIKNMQPKGKVYRCISCNKRMPEQMLTCGKCGKQQREVKQSEE